MKRLSLKKAFTKAITIAGLAISQAQAWVGPPANATKIFDASFYGASITQTRYSNGYWVGNISGGQWTAGIPNTLPGMSNYFNYLVSDTTLLDYLENYIGTDTMPWGSYPEPVQIMKVKKDDPNLSAVSRVHHNWFPDTSVRDVYVEYYIKLQDNLLQVMPDQGVFMWRQLMEFDETQPAGASTILRAELSINRIPDGQGHSQIGWLGNVSTYPGFVSVPNGYLFNASVPIPQGKWFLLTVHYKLHPTEGAFEAGIRVCKDGGGFEGDQQQLFSFTNIKTASGDTRINVINFLKTYAGENILANGAVWQNIYNARVWVVF